MVEAAYSDESDDTVESISREKIRRLGFKEFVKQAWHLIEPSTPLVWNWHFDAICSHLQAVTEGRIPRLIINVPPGSGKSSLTSVLWPAWVWTLQPHKRFLCASHKETLALRDSVRRRNVIMSDWYQARWPIKLAGDANLKSEFSNTATGHMVALGTGGSTGYRGDYLLMDDPNNATEMESEVQRESTLLWLDQQWSSRGNKDAREVVIQQRTHESDVTGHLLSQGGFELLKIPMRWAESQNATSIGWLDPRDTKNQLMWPEVYSEDRVNTLAKRLGPYGAAGQLQQEPAPAEGGIIKRAWIRHYEITEGRYDIGDYKIDPMNCMRFATVDLATSKKDTDKADPDFTVIAVWAVFHSHRGTIVLLLDLVRERLEGPDIEKKLDAMYKTWGFSVEAIETVGFQLNIAQQLIRKGHPVREVSSSLDAIYRIDKDKVARAYGSTPLMADGRFYVPTYAHWLGEYISELIRFPAAAHDDQVDVTSIALAIADKIPATSLYQQLVNKPIEIASSVDAGYNSGERDEVIDALEGFRSSGGM